MEREKCVSMFNSGFRKLVEGVVLETTSRMRVSPFAPRLYLLNDPSNCRDFHPAVLKPIIKNEHKANLSAGFVEMSGLEPKLQVPKT